MRHSNHALALKDDYVKDVEQDSLCVGPMVLKEIKGDASIFIKGDDFAIQERADWQPFTRLGDLRELRGKVVAPTGRDRYTGLVSAHQGAIAIELYFVLPVSALGMLFKASAYTGSIKRVLLLSNLVVFT